MNKTLRKYRLRAEYREPVLQILKEINIYLLSLVQTDNFALCLDVKRAVILFINNKASPRCRTAYVTCRK